MTGEQEHIRVVLVEDNTDLRESLTDLIDRASGMSCVASFAAAPPLLAQAAALGPDVVLMDIGLPVMSGIEAVRLLKEILPAVSVLMLTVYEDEERIFASIRAGAAGYLLKRASPERILQAIEEVHAGGAPMTSVIARKVLEAIQGTTARGEALPISDRELDILRELVTGASYRQVASACCISVDTVRSHVRHIYEKLHVHSKAEAVALALRRRLF